MSSPPIEIGNYDVLLEKIAADNDSNKYKLYQDGHIHVGNNRFQVLLNMHRGDFDAKLKAKEDTTSTVETIVEVITTHCKPNGRFLVRDQQDAVNSWKLLEKDAIVQFVRETLLESKEDDAGTEGQKKSPSPPPPVQSQSLKDTGNKKRGRRASLLRRSVSEAVVPFRRNIEDRKKNIRTERRPSFWNSIRSRKSIALIQTPEPLDVLFENNDQSLQAGNHVGNNRLQVLMDVQRGKYVKAKIEEQQSMVQDLIKTVTTFWGGRFLCQKDGGYEVMNEDRAEVALQQLLSTPPLPSSSSPMSTSPNNDNDDDKKPPAKVKQEAVAAIHQFQPPLDVQHMRSQALESLQKKKKRQGLASRIRSLAANAFTRSISEPIVQPTSRQSMSPTTDDNNHNVHHHRMFYDVDSLEQVPEPLAFAPGSGPTKMSGRPSELSQGLAEDLLRTFNGGDFENPRLEDLLEDSREFSEELRKSASR